MACLVYGTHTTKTSSLNRPEKTQHNILEYIKKYNFDMVATQIGKRESGAHQCIHMPQPIHGTVPSNFPPKLFYHRVVPYEVEN